MRVLGDVRVGWLIFGNMNSVRTLEIAGKFENLATVAASFDARMPQVVLINNNPNYCIENGLVFSADKKVLYSHDGKTAINEIILPATVEKIMPYALYMHTLDKVTFSKNLKTIGEYAFYQSGLEKLVIPKNVETIGEYAFCDNLLTSVKFNKKIKTIGKGAFESNEIKNVRFYNYPKIGMFALDKNVTKEYYGEKKISGSVVKVNVKQSKLKYQITIHKKVKKSAKYKITIKYGKKKITKEINLKKGKKKKTLSVKMKKKALDKKHKIYVKVKTKGKWSKKVRIL